MDESLAASEDYETRGMYEQSFQCLWDCISSSEVTTQFMITTIKTGNRISIQLIHQQHSDQAKRILEKTLQCTEKLDVEDGVGLSLKSTTFNNLGIACATLKEKDLCLRYFHEAIRIEKDIHGAPVASTLIPYSQALLTFGKYADSVMQAKGALRALEGTNSHMIVTAYTTLGTALEHHGSPSAMSQAADAFRHAFQAAKDIYEPEEPQYQEAEASWKRFMGKVVGNRPTSGGGHRQSVQSSSVYSGQSGRHHREDAASSKLNPLTNQYAVRMQAKQLKKLSQEEREKHSIQLAKRLYEKEKVLRAKKDAEDEERRNNEASRIMYEQAAEAARIEEAKRYMEATEKIQKLWRAYLVRDLLCRWVKAAVRIQSVFRSFWCRRSRKIEMELRMREAQHAAYMEKLKKASVRVQSWWRMLVCISHLRILRKGNAARKIHSAYLIHRAYRRYRKRKNDELRREQEEMQEMLHKHLKSIHRAALRIQTNFRRYMAQKLLMKLRQSNRTKTQAAKVIQKNVRGYLCRIHLKRDRPALIARNKQQRRMLLAAVKIQKVVRGFLARRLAKRIFLRNAKRSTVTRIHQAAVKIQCSWKVKLAREKLSALTAKRDLKHRKITLVQSVCRSFMCLKQSTKKIAAKKLLFAIQRIQRWWLLCVRKKRNNEVAKYHADLRAKEKSALRRTGAAMKLQSWQRGNQGRKIALKRKVEHQFRVRQAVIIQSVWRMHVAKKELRLLKRLHKKVLQSELVAKKQRTCAIQIQSLFRMYLAKKALRILQTRFSCAERIQRNYKIHFSRAKLAALRDERTERQRHVSAIRIQRSVRLFIRRLRLYRLRKYYLGQRAEKALLQRKQESAITIQAAWRGHSTRKKVLAHHAQLLAKTADAMKIQNAFRAFLFRKKLQRHIENKLIKSAKQKTAATKIQSFWKMVVTQEYVRKLKLERNVKTDAVIKIQNAQRRVNAKLQYDTMKLAKESQRQAQILKELKWMNSIEVLQRLCQAKYSMQQCLLRKKSLIADLQQAIQLKLFKKRHNAAAKIQALYRGTEERIYVRGLRKEREAERQLAANKQLRILTSCVTIQCAMRKYRATKRVKEMRAQKEAVITENKLKQQLAAEPQDIIAGMFAALEAESNRKVLSEQRFRHARNHKAATDIQRVVKGHQSRSTTERVFIATKREDAAINVQRFYRSYLTNRMAKIMAEKHKAARRIQALYRRFCVRKELRRRIADRHVDHERKVHDEESRDRAATRIANAYRCLSPKGIIP